MLLDRGFVVEPYVYDELDYSNSYVNNTLLRMCRSTDRVDRIVLEMKNGQGGSLYNMKKLYEDTDLSSVYYLDIYTYYPTIYRRLKKLFAFDISDPELEDGKRVVVTRWVNDRIHSEDFREYVYDKIKNGV